MSARARSPCAEPTTLDEIADMVGKVLYDNANNSVIWHALRTFCKNNPRNKEAAKIRRRLKQFAHDHHSDVRDVEKYLRSFYDPASTVTGLSLPDLKDEDLGINADGNNGTHTPDTTPLDTWHISSPAMAVYNLMFVQLARLVVTHVTACVLGYSQYYVTCYICLCTVGPMIILWLNQPSQNAFAQATVLLYTKLGGMMMSRTCIVLFMLLLRLILSSSSHSNTSQQIMGQVAWVFDIISNLFYCWIAFNSITDEQENGSMPDTCHWFCVGWAGGFRQVQHTLQQTWWNKTINTGIVHTLLLCVILYLARCINTGASQLTRTFLCTGMVLSVWLPNTLQGAKKMCLRAVIRQTQSEESKLQTRVVVLKIATVMCVAALIALTIHEFYMSFSKESNDGGAGKQSSTQGNSKSTENTFEVCWKTVTGVFKWFMQKLVVYAAHILFLPPLFLLDCTDIHLVQGVYEKCGLFVMYAEQAFRGSGTQCRMYRLH